MKKTNPPFTSEKIADTTDHFSAVWERTQKLVGWQIFWHVGCNKAGILEVHFIVRTPQTTPGLPDGSKVMQIFGSVCDHVEREPEFVGTGAGWRNWILALSSKKLVVQPLLQAVTPKCGCDPWLDSRLSAEVYQSLCEWLERLDKGL